MPTLFPHLPCYIGETALSFGTRLAAFHLDQTLVPFLHDFGVRPDALVRGEADAFDRMADAAGVDAGILHRNSARSVAKSDYTLRGHELSGEVFSRPDTAFCPECLLEDDAYGAKDVAAFRRQRMRGRCGLSVPALDMACPSFTDMSEVTIENFTGSRVKCLSAVTNSVG